MTIEVDSNLYSEYSIGLVCEREIRTKNATPVLIFSGECISNVLEKKDIISTQILLWKTNKSNFVAEILVKRSTSSRIEVSTRVGHNARKLIQSLEYTNGFLGNLSKKLLEEGSKYDNEIRTAYIDYMSVREV